MFCWWIAAQREEDGWLPRLVCRQFDSSFDLWIAAQCEKMVSASALINIHLAYLVKILLRRSTSVNY